MGDRGDMDDKGDMGNRADRIERANRADRASEYSYCSQLKMGSLTHSLTDHASASKKIYPPF